MRTAALTLIWFTTLIDTAVVFAQAWTVDSVAIAPTRDEEGPRTLAIAAHNASGRRSRIAESVVLSAIEDTFVKGDRLVVLGRAHRPWAVYIFDLRTGRREDWFFCGRPKRISSDWIAYIEFYPDHVPAAFNDVVLIYDLTRSPGENRFGKEKSVAASEPGTDAPVRVGIPVFPELNAQTKIYENVAPNLASVESVVLPYPFIMLGLRLVFIGARGEYPEPHSDYIAVVDLSRGPEQSSLRALEIPRELFARPGRDPRFVDVKALEPDGSDAVRLLVPQAEYGVDSIRVDLTRSQAPPPSPVTSQSTIEIPPGTQYIRVGEAMQASKLLRKEPEPVWSGPPAQVVFEALVGPDGKVQKLRFVSGPGELVMTAEQIASSLVYRETALNGEKVSVLTSIAIRFKHE